MKEPDYTNYDEYMKFVDVILEKTIGMSHHCLADFNSMFCFEDEIHPIWAAIECLEQQDDFGGLIADTINRLEGIATREKL